VLSVISYADEEDAVRIANDTSYGLQAYELSGGVCAVKVTGGAPDHRDTFLTPEQRDAGGMMCVCVSRATTDTLTLDL
jgi:hypothetical protein